MGSIPYLCLVLIGNDRHWALIEAVLTNAMDLMNDPDQVISLTDCLRRKLLTIYEVALDLLCLLDFDFPLGIHLPYHMDDLI